jgi:hypothetical protein
LTELSTFNVTDFTLSVTANNLTDGGIVVHGNGGNSQQIILVLGGNNYGQGSRGGNAGTSAYWVVNNTSGPLDQVNGVFVPGNDYNLTVKAVGDTYSLYVNGSSTATTTLTTTTDPSGFVGLYDDQPNTSQGGSGPTMTFSTFSLQATNVPEPTTLAWGGLGSLASLLAIRRRK